MAFAYSVTGPGPAAVTVSGCGPQTVELSRPILLLGPMLADANGQAVLRVPVPPGAGGRSVWLQAFDAVSCRLSNALAETIG